MTGELQHRGGVRVKLVHSSHWKRSGMYRLQRAQVRHTPELDHNQESRKQAKWFDMVKLFARPSYWCNSATQLHIHSSSVYSGSPLHLNRGEESPPQFLTDKDLPALHMPRGRERVHGASAYPWALACPTSLETGWRTFASWRPPHDMLWSGPSGSHMGHEMEGGLFQLIIHSKKTTGNSAFTPPLQTFWLHFELSHPSH